MNYSLLNDSALIAKIAYRDRNALEALYTRHAGQVLGMVTALLNGNSQSQDITLEAFWRVWQLASHFDVTNGDASAWLYSIAHQLASDSIRPIVDETCVMLPMTSYHQAAGD